MKLLQVEKLKFPGTTASYRAYHIEAIVQDAKHTACRVSDTPFDPTDNENIPTVAYELPDGQEIQVGADRFAVPEVMFNPTLLSRFGEVGQQIQGYTPDALHGLHQVWSLHRLEICSMLQT
jgi:actin-related protein